jgi:hypothetical protein
VSERIIEGRFYPVLVFCEAIVIVGVGQGRPAPEGAGVAEDAKLCQNCGKVMEDRVEEEVRTGGMGSQSTGECDTYRIWACVNPDCVMFKTDLIKEIIISK